MTSSKQHSDDTCVRLDKWLWAARFFKTRSLAKKNIEQGKVLYNGQKASPSRLVHIGAELVVPQGYDQKTIIVQQLSDKRLGFEQAQTLYEETQASRLQREKNLEQRKTDKYLRASPKPDKRPDKKAREKLRKIRRSDS